jgi:signal peptidase I
VSRNTKRKVADTKELDSTHETGPSFEKSTVREYFESICVAVILALFIRTFVFQAFKIPTGSMEENLLIGDHLIVNKMLYSPAGAFEDAVAPLREVRRKDVVVFKFPEDPKRDFIKRVIGLPGERIRIEDKKVYVDDVALDEPYTFFQDTGAMSPGFNSDSMRDSMPELIVPEGHYFVMGDNRDNSHDSRYWGPLDADLLKGRALIIYWSYESDREAYTKQGWDYWQEKLSLLPYPRRARSGPNQGELEWGFITNTRWGRSFHLVR